MERGRRERKWGLKAGRKEREREKKKWGHKERERWGQREKEMGEKDAADPNFRKKEKSQQGPIIYLKIENI